MEIIRTTLRRTTIDIIRTTMDGLRKTQMNVTDNFKKDNDGRYGHKIDTDGCNIKGNDEQLGTTLRRTT